MKKFLFLFSLLNTFLLVQAQKDSLKFEEYANNIFKITIKPKGYTKDENISDAVILQPKKKARFRAIELEGVTIFRERGVLLSSHVANENYGFQLQLSPDEKVFGGGERALPLNRRGYRLNLYNNPWYGYGEGADNLNYSVPFITSSKGYGLFFDNPSKGYLDIGKTNPDVLEYGASSGEINVFIIFGDYQTILQSYHKLTGTQPLPPRWALGNFMSRFGYTSEQQVKEIYSKMKGANIPVDAVIFDLFWFGDSIKGTLGNLDWVNKTKWPHPKRMIADFKKEGVQTILVTEPFFVETSKNYKASKPYLAVDSLGKPYYLTDFYFGKGGLLDIFRKDAQSWFWRFYKQQMLNGVEAWWGDLGEPEKHPSNMYHNLKDFGYKRLFSADEVHNIYGHSWTKMLYNFYAKEYPNKRLFSLNRSGFAGSQRYSIFPWTGDVSRSWSGFRAQLPILLGMSMSGVPYVHSDAGGFAGGEGDEELYVRWLQFAAFTPIFRPHGTALYEVDTAAFSFPSEAALVKEPYKGYAKQAIGWRYEFLSYNYSLAYQQTRYGKPLIAPLYYYFQNDTAAVTIEDEYMWGENILVVPVVEKGAQTRKYYLPGGRWMDIFHHRILDGEKWYTDSTSLKLIPVFIKEGGFVPINDYLGSDNTTMRKSNMQGVIYVPSSRSSSFTQYDDDGIGRNAIANGQYQITTYTSSGLQNNQLVISIKRDKKKLAKPYSKGLSLLIPGLRTRPASILINSTPFNSYHFREDNSNSDRNLLTMILENPSDSITIKIKW